MRTVIYFLLMALIAACVPPDHTRNLEIRIDYQEEDQRLIRDHENRRETAMVVPFLESSDVSLRLLAAQALASIQDSSSITALGNTLKNDFSQDVRRYAAYALGQTGHPDAAVALIDAFTYQDTSQLNNPVRQAILEGVGKTGTPTHLNQIATVTSYGPDDHFLIRGQALAIYRFSLRQIVSQSGTDKMIQFAANPSMDREARLIAANYLRRTRDIQLDTMPGELVNALLLEGDPDIRMALVTAVTRYGGADVQAMLAERMAEEPDNRVKVNWLRALDETHYDIWQNTVDTLVFSDQYPIAVQSSQALIDRAPPNERAGLLDFARSAQNHTVKALLYAGSLRRTPPYFVNSRAIINNEIQVLLREEQNPYVQQQLLMALAEDPGNMATLKDLFDNDSTSVFRTFCVNAMHAMATSPRFEIFYPTIAARNQALQVVYEFVANVLSSGNAGALAAAGPIITHEANNFKDRIEIRPMLRNAIRNLDLPAELETKQVLDNALAFLEGKEPETALSVNKNIDWSVVGRCTDSTFAVIRTTQGRIEVSLDHKTAPSSVANFISLSLNGYYNGKTFHRVVPNFVIQGGCPRGDGFGSLDYTIASELGPNYYNAAGKLGMASAGKDTEGVQWFITHSPTPHLDGRYTLFGEVTSGMDIVHAITPGDVIQDITILNMRFQ